MRVQEKWQEKINLPHLKKIQKEHIEVYYRIFISVLLHEIFSPTINQRTVRHLGLIFNRIQYVLVTSQQG